MPDPSGVNPDPIELDPAPGDFVPDRDDRARMPEPVPVRLIAVEDVRLPAQAGLEAEMDAFYVTLLQFAKDYGDETTTVYRADNFRIIFAVRDGLITRDGYRPLGVEVPSLRETELAIIERELEYTRQRGLLPGQQALLILDPSGNPLELIELRRVM